MTYTVTVAYASPTQQIEIDCQTECDQTVLQVIERSGVLKRFPEIDITLQSVGINSRLVNLSSKIQPNDRIEIYRPLTLEPMQARRLRAKKNN